MAWTAARGVRHLFDDAGCPIQNAYIESFDGEFRDEGTSKKGRSDCRIAWIYEAGIKLDVEVSCAESSIEPSQ